MFYIASIVLITIVITAFVEILIMYCAQKIQVSIYLYPISFSFCPQRNALLQLYPGIYGYEWPGLSAAQQRWSGMAPAKQASATCLSRGNWRRGEALKNHPGSRPLAPARAERQLWTRLRLLWTLERLA